MELKVAVIGCGGRGRGHVKTLAQFPDVDLVAVCDPIEESRQNVIDEHQISKGYSDLATMLDSETLDAVWVAPPAHLNMEVALPCLERGVNTLMEKPPGLSSEQAQQLREAAQKTGAKAMVGWNRRFNGFITAAREQVEACGKVIQVVGEFHKNIHQLVDSGKFSPSICDLMLLESPIHAIDTVRAIAGGKVTEVHSVVRRTISDYRDMHGATIVFDNDCLVHLIANYTAGRRLERYEIHGHNISAYLEGVSEGKICRDGQVTELTKPEEDSTWLQNRYFIDRIKANLPIELPAANLDEAVKTMDLAMQILAGTRA